MAKSAESEWVRYVRERYDPNPDIMLSYSARAELLLLLNGPEAHGIEDKMLAYAKAHPNATMHELCDYCAEIC